MAGRSSRGAANLTVRGKSRTSRGRGSIGRGGAWRGRGRGGGLRKPVFDSARLLEKADDTNSESESIVQSENEESKEQSGTSEDERDDSMPLKQSYDALIQSLSAQCAPPAKRRKLDYNETATESQGQENHSNEEAQEDEEVYGEAAEEGPEASSDDVLEHDVADDASDPFTAHFADPQENELSRALKSIKREEWNSQRTTVPDIGTAIISLPAGIAGDKDFKIDLLSTPQSLNLKEKLSKAMQQKRPLFDVLEKAIAPLMFSYKDLLLCERTHKNAVSLRRLACLHALNHVFKTRDRVIKNNALLAKEEGDTDLELRDQGFTRPKVLIILPTRQSCVRILDSIVSICEPEQQENRKRFDDSFAAPPDETAATKPDDFKELFEGNDDDMFRLGLKFTRRTVKYFAQFYNSDIIMASPLGLRTAIVKDGKRPDYDFLSSIEVVIVDQADALLMQNWEHVDFIFEHLNLQPSEARGCDFSRVRTWYLDQNAKYFRQTIALTAFNTPEVNNLFYNHSLNWGGKVKIKGQYKGAIQELPLKVHQTFSKLESPSDSEDPDTRFTYFTSAIIPALTRKRKNISGVLVFIPSYFDFVRVRDYFLNADSTSHVSFGCISEYTPVRDVARARSHFLTGRHSVLLYTERAHHFNRFQIRGVKDVIMYALPGNPIFYKEIAGYYLEKSLREGKLVSKKGSVRAIFSKLDIMKLERVVGTDRVSKMISDKGDTFEFW